MTLRARFLAKLPLGVGLTGKAGPTREAYALHLGGPDEDHDIAIAMASYRDGKRFSSTCGLEMRRCLRDAGYVDPKRISGKYRPRMGLVMSDLEAIAVEHGAKVDPSLGTLPKSGDIAALAWTDPSHAHVLGIESVELVDERTLRIVAVEGGQIDREQPPNQVTARKIHTWKWHPELGARGQWLDTSIAIEPVGVVVDGVTARPVSWWIDLDKLDASTSKTDPAPPPSDPSGIGVIPQGSGSVEPLPSVTLRKGSTGPAVKRWQTIIGVIPPRVDGIFGSGTEALTKVWQTRHGLTPDGVVGARSWATAIGAGTAPSVGRSTRPDGAGAPQPTIDGIDVSSIQGVIDWERVAAAGIRFAYVRTVIGLDTRDTMRAINAARARKAGVELGMYGVCYPRHGRAQDAERQGAQLAADHKASGATLRPMIDFESLKDVPDATPIEWSNALTAYIAGLGAAGLDPILYTYPSFWRGLGDVFSSSRWAQYPLWIAHYTKAAQPDVPPPWTKALVWQYAASAPGFEGRVDGVPGLVDRNRLFGSLDDLRVRRL